MSNRRDWSRCIGFRLTHKPTGIFVDAYAANLRGVRSPHHPKLMEMAKGWLAAKVWFSRNSDKPAGNPMIPGERVRNYRLGSTDQPVLDWAALKSKTYETPGFWKVPSG